MDSNTTSKLVSEKKIYTQIIDFLLSFRRKHYKNQIFLEAPYKFLNESATNDEKLQNELTNILGELRLYLCQNDKNLMDNMDGNASVKVNPNEELESFMTFIFDKNIESPTDRLNLTNVVYNYSSDKKVEINEEITKEYERFIENQKEYFELLKLPYEQNRIEVGLYDKINDNRDISNYFRLVKYCYNINSETELLKITIKTDNMKLARTEDYIGLIENFPKLITAFHFIQGLLDLEELKQYGTNE